MYLSNIELSFTPVCDQRPDYRHQSRNRIKETSNRQRIQLPSTKAEIRNVNVPSILSAPSSSSDSSLSSSFDGPKHWYNGEKENVRSPRVKVNKKYRNKHYMQPRVFDTLSKYTVGKSASFSEQDDNSGVVRNANSSYTKHRHKTSTPKIPDIKTDIRHSTYRTPADNDESFTTIQQRQIHGQKSTSDEGGPYQHICDLMKTRTPGKELELYLSVVKLCRQYLETLLKEKDRKRVCKVYLKALELLFKQHHQRRQNVDDDGIKYPRISNSDIHNSVPSCSDLDNYPRTSIRDKQNGVPSCGDLDNLSLASLVSYLQNLRANIKTLKMKKEEVKRLARENTCDLKETEELKLAYSTITSQLETLKNQFEQARHHAKTKYKQQIQNRKSNSNLNPCSDTERLTQQGVQLYHRQQPKTFGIKGPNSGYIPEERKRFNVHMTDGDTRRTSRPISIRNELLHSSKIDEEELSGNKGDQTNRKNLSKSDSVKSFERNEISAQLGHLQIPETYAPSFTDSNNHDMVRLTKGAYTNTPSFTDSNNHGRIRFTEDVYTKTEFKKAPENVKILYTSKDFDDALNFNNRFPRKFRNKSGNFDETNDLDLNKTSKHQKMVNTQRDEDRSANIKKQNKEKRKFSNGETNSNFNHKSSEHQIRCQIGGGDVTFPSIPAIEREIFGEYDIVDAGVIVHPGSSQHHATLKRQETMEKNCKNMNSSSNNNNNDNNNNNTNSKNGNVIAGAINSTNNADNLSAVKKLTKEIITNKRNENQSIDHDNVAGDSSGKYAPKTNIDIAAVKETYQMLEEKYQNVKTKKKSTPANSFQNAEAGKTKRKYKKPKGTHGENDCQQDGEVEESEILLENLKPATQTPPLSPDNSEIVNFSATNQEYSISSPSNVQRKNTIVKESFILETNVDVQFNQQNSRQISEHKTTQTKADLQAVTSFQTRSIGVATELGESPPMGVTRQYKRNHLSNCNCICGGCCCNERNNNDDACSYNNVVGTTANAYPREHYPREHCSSKSERKEPHTTLQKQSVHSPTNSMVDQLETDKICDQPIKETLSFSYQNQLESSPNLLAEIDQLKLNQQISSDDKGDKNSRNNYENYAVYQTSRGHNHHQHPKRHSDNYENNAACYTPRDYTDDFMEFLDPRKNIFLEEHDDQDGFQQARVLSTNSVHLSDCSQAIPVQLTQDERHYEHLVVPKTKKLDDDFMEVLDPQKNIFLEEYDETNSLKQATRTSLGTEHYSQAVPKTIGKSKQKESFHEEQNKFDEVANNQETYERNCCEMSEEIPMPFDTRGVTNEKKDTSDDNKFEKADSNHHDGGCIERKQCKERDENLFFLPQTAPVKTHEGESEGSYSSEEFKKQEDIITKYTNVTTKRHWQRDDADGTECDEEELAEKTTTPYVREQTSRELEKEQMSSISDTEEKPREADTKAGADMGKMSRKIIIQETLTTKEANMENTEDEIKAIRTPECIEATMLPHIREEMVQCDTVNDQENIPDQLFENVELSTQDRTEAVAEDYIKPEDKIPEHSEFSPPPTVECEMRRQLLSIPEKKTKILDKNKDPAESQEYCNGDSTIEDTEVCEIDQISDGQENTVNEERIHDMQGDVEQLFDVSLKTDKTIEDNEEMVHFTTETQLFQGDEEKFNLGQTPEDYLSPAATQTESLLEEDPTRKIYIPIKNSSKISTKINSEISPKQQRNEIGRHVQETSTKNSIRVEDDLEDESPSSRDIMQEIYERSRTISFSDSETESESAQENESPCHHKNKDACQDSNGVNDHDNKDAGSDKNNDSVFKSSGNNNGINAAISGQNEKNQPCEHDNIGTLHERVGEDEEICYTKKNEEEIIVGGDEHDACCNVQEDVENYTNNSYENRVKDTDQVENEIQNVCTTEEIGAGITEECLQLLKAYTKENKLVTDNSSSTEDLLQEIRSVFNDEKLTDEEKKKKLESFLLLNYYGENEAKKIISLINQDILYFIHMKPSQELLSDTVDCGYVFRVPDDAGDMSPGIAEGTCASRANNDLMKYSLKSSGYPIFDSELSTADTIESFTVRPYPWESTIDPFHISYDRNIHTFIGRNYSRNGQIVEDQNHDEYDDSPRKTSHSEVPRILLKNERDLCEDDRTLHANSNIGHLGGSNSTTFASDCKDQSLKWITFSLYGNKNENNLLLPEVLQKSENLPSTKAVVTYHETTDGEQIKECLFMLYGEKYDQEEEKNQDEIDSSGNNNNNFPEYRTSEKNQDYTNCENNHRSEKKGRNDNRILQVREPDLTFEDCKVSDECDDGIQKFTNTQAAGNVEMTITTEDSITAGDNSVKNLCHPHTENSDGCHRVGKDYPYCFLKGMLPEDRDHQINKKNLEIEIKPQNHDIAMGDNPRTDITTKDYNTQVRNKRENTPLADIQGNDCNMEEGDKPTADKFGLDDNLMQVDKENNVAMCDTIIARNYKENENMEVLNGKAAVHKEHSHLPRVATIGEKVTALEHYNPNDLFTIDNQVPGCDQEIGEIKSEEMKTDDMDISEDEDEIIEFFNHLRNQDTIQSTRPGNNTRNVRPRLQNESSGSFRRPYSHQNHSFKRSDDSVSVFNEEKQSTDNNVINFPIDDIAIKEKRNFDDLGFYENNASDCGKTIEKNLDSSLHSELGDSGFCSGNDTVNLDDSSNNSYKNGTPNTTTYLEIHKEQQHLNGSFCGNGDDNTIDGSDFPNESHMEEERNLEFVNERCSSFVEPENLQIQHSMKTAPDNPFHNKQLYFEWLHDFGEALIVDPGSGTIKAGLATYDKPMHIPSIVGTPNYQKVFPCEADVITDWMMGDDAANHRGVLKLKYPIQHGTVQDWNNFEKLLNYTLHSSLKVSPNEHPLIITESVYTPRVSRERIMEIMFETHDVPAYYTAMQGVMSLYSYGMTTGTVLDIGESITQVVPVYEGYTIAHACESIKLGGRDITEYLQQLMGKQGKSMTTTAEYEITKELKEALCFVATDQENFRGLTSSKRKEYELPDGHHISIDTEQTSAPELLFDPLILGKEQSGIHQQVYNGIRKCDMDVRRDLYSNIVLAGGSTLFPGLSQRLSKEMKDLVEPLASRMIRIRENEQGINSTWKGASILSTLSTFQNMWIAREEYDEHGSSIVHMKCF